MSVEDLRLELERAERLSDQLAPEDQKRLAGYVFDLLRRVGREPRGAQRRFGATLKAFLVNGQAAGVQP